MKKVLLKAAALITAALMALPGGFALAQEEAVPTLTINMTEETHDILHGAAGFLYGISNEGVPDVNTLTPLKPKVLATKGALGTEHPYGDALDVADEFFEAGGQQVQMYCSNYYGVFGVTADAFEYGEVLENIIAPKVLEWKNEKREKYPDIDDRIVYIPINEGTPRNYNGGERTIMNSWKVYYDAIKKADPNAAIAGPNNATYGDSYGRMREFLTFCRDNDCLPDIVTWHELQVPCLGTMGSHIDDYRRICRDLGIEEKQVVINEYADYADCGVPGRLVNWIGRLEDNEVYGCLPFWHQANNLNDLAAGANEGNGAWWVYKWYGDMSGKTLKVRQSNTPVSGLYGTAAIDKNKKTASVILGGTDGNAEIRLDNIDDTACFKGANKVHVKVEASYFSSYHGASYGTEKVIEGTYALDDNGGLTIELDNMLFSTAYNITVTEALPEDEVTAPSTGAYRKEYEAENARRFGAASYEAQNAYPPYYYSGNARVNNFNSTSDGIEYDIEVPFAGRYKLEFIYGNGVGESRNDMYSHNPKNLNHIITLDGGPEEILPLNNTLFYAMEGKTDKYYDLTKGSHKVKITGDGVLSGGTQDVLYLSYAGAYGEEISFDEKFEAEAADYNVLGELTETAVSTESDIAGCSKSGYAFGLNVNPVTEGGGIRQIVNVPKSGLYGLSFRYNSKENGIIRIYQDNTNFTYDNFAASAEVTASDKWETTGAALFLKKGINLIDIDTDCEAAVDYMRVFKIEDDLSETYEAEDGEGNFKTVTSGGRTYVMEMLAGGEEYLLLTVNAPRDGKYKMQVFQSNNDLCGSHNYNIKIIDRYASFEVNGDSENAQRYFFPNSFSDDTFLEKTIPLELKEGENKIKIYNDDSWHVLWGGSTSTPGTNKLVNYTPNFDKFIITPAETKWEEKLSYPIELSYTENGVMYCDKNEAAAGESVKVTLVPDGTVKKFTLNGRDIRDELYTEDDSVYTADILVSGETALYAEFTPASEGKFEAPVLPETNIFEKDGKFYKAVGENLFKNGDFNDPGGRDMEQWYVGVNKSGHPTDANYQIPSIKPDGSLENLVPLTKSGLLTTGGFEKDAPDTFYYGADGRSNYLVEHMSSDWHNCAWNGAHSLLAFVPVKPNKKYVFSCKAYSVSGQASVRYGAVKMGSFVPEKYNTKETLGFSGTGFVTCQNGDMQNVGGSWKTYETVIDTGDGDYFLFNAYWLQMAEYLCLGDFKLYELSDEPLTEISKIEPLPALTVRAGEKLTLQAMAKGVCVNGETVPLPITWLNENGVDVSKAGVYSATGYVELPENYNYGGSLYVKQRVTVKPALAAEIKAENADGKVKIAVTAVEDCSGILYAADENKVIKSFKVELAAGEKFEAEIGTEKPIDLMFWTEELKPLAEKVRVRAAK